MYLEEGLGKAVDLAIVLNLYSEIWIVGYSIKQLNLKLRDKEHSQFVEFIEPLAYTYLTFS